MQIEPPCPVQHGDFVVVRLFAYLHDIEAVVEGLAQQFLQAHATVRPLPDIAPRKLGKRVLFSACRTIDVDPASGFQAAPDALEKPAVFGHVFDHAVGHDGVKGLPGPVGEKILQQDRRLQMAPSNNVLDVIVGILEQREPGNLDAARAEVGEGAAPARADVQQAHTRPQVQRPKRALQLALCGLLQGLIIALNEAMRVKPVAGIEKMEIEVIAERVMPFYDPPVGAARRGKKKVGQKTQPGGEAPLVGELLAHLQDRQHVAFEVEIALHVGFSQRKLVDRTPQQPPSAYRDLETGSAFAERYDLSVRQLDLTWNVEILKKLFQPVLRSRTPNPQVQSGFRP